jgi:hypothetical protein
MVVAIKFTTDQLPVSVLPRGSPFSSAGNPGLLTLAPIEEAQMLDAAWRRRT